MSSGLCPGNLLHVATPEQRRSAAVAAIASAWDAGCPVAGTNDDEFRQRADIAVRRWESIGRRHRGALSAEERIEDLAKGLRNGFENDGKLVGPLMDDYRYLAGQIAEALSACA